jgi:peptide/nickel transport system permease protein
MSTQPTESLIIDNEVSQHDDAFTEAPESGGGRRSQSRSRLILRRFLRNKMAVVGLVFLILLFLFAFIGPHFTKWKYNDNDFTSFLKPPSRQHFFGTTQSGQDVYARTLRGMQKSLIIGLLTAFISTGLAAIVGSAAAYFGGFVDRALMWVVDLLLVVPSFLIIAILSSSFRGKTWLIFVVLLAGFSWMITARAIRGMTMSLREREYVIAARYMGVNPGKIIVRHVLPNIASYLIVDVTLGVGGAILAEAGLSFFGFGIQPPDVSLGTLLQEGQSSATTYPWLFAFCGGFLVLIILSVNFIGDGLRDAFDPSSSSSRAR